jgi:hypothetical protein
MEEISLGLAHAALIHTFDNVVNPSFLSPLVLSAQQVSQHGSSIAGTAMLAPFFRLQPHSQKENGRR